MFYISLLILLSARLIAIIFIPLYDTTEARYGEIAREMLISNDWSSLFLNNKVFLAKPPFSTWLSALSMKIFGINEFAVRFPSIILSILCILVLLNFTKNYFNNIQKKVFVLICSSCGIFYATSGMVMTDITALLSCLLMQTIFYKLTLEKSNKLIIFYSILLSFTAGLAMLTRGLVVLVLAGLPCLIWLIIENKLLSFIKKINFFITIPIFLITFLPWYLYTEIRFPGYLNYFIIGEHFSRFLKQSWGGDMYGTAKNEAFGSIWLFFIMGTFPWVLLPILNFFKSSYNLIILMNKLGIKNAKIFIKHNNILQKIYNIFFHKLNSFDRFIVISMITPNLFFTFAQNLILSYTLTTIPYFAILINKFGNNYLIKNNKIQNIIYYFVYLISTLSIAIVIYIYSPFGNLMTGKKAVKLYETITQNDYKNKKLIYFRDNYYSVMFYSNNKAIYINNYRTLINDKRFKNKTIYFIIKQSQLKGFTQQFKNYFANKNPYTMKQISIKNNFYLLIELNFIHNF